MRRGLRTFLTLVEGLRFMWACRKLTYSYVQWRLGTVYGSFDSQGNARSVGDLLEALWRDRNQVMDFLAWRRDMRLRRR